MLVAPARILRRILLLGGVVLAATNAGAPAGRIEGQIFLSPTTPVARAGEPNRRPIAGEVSVIDRHGNVVVHIASDHSGNFHIALAPGHYTLRLESPRGIGRPTPVETTVTAGEVTKVVIAVDSGIR